MEGLFRSKVDGFVPHAQNVNLRTVEVVVMVSKAVLGEAASWKVFFAISAQICTDVNLRTGEVVEMVSKAVLGEAASWKVLFAEKWTDLYRRPSMST